MENGSKINSRDAYIHFLDITIDIAAREEDPSDFELQALAQNFVDSETHENPEMLRMTTQLKHLDRSAERRVLNEYSVWYADY